MKLHRIRALLLKYWYISINRVDRIFDVFYWPFIDLFVWGFASTFIEEISEFNVLSMLLGGIILWMFVWRASQDMAVYVLEDFWSRSLYHVFSSPVKLSEHITSIVLIGFLRAMTSFVFMAGFAYILYSFNIFEISPLYVGISVLLLSLFGWTMGLFVTSMILIFGKRVQVIAWSSVWLIQPFSCVFYPITSLPKWAVPIATYLPTTYIFENLRSLLFEGTVNHMQLVYAFLLELVLLAVMIFVLRKSFQKAKNTGLLAKVR